MKIKRFVAPDTREALRLVREDLGPDAVVLSSRRSEEGAEIIVAVDYDEKAVADMAETSKAPEPRPVRGAAKAEPPGAAPPPSRRSTGAPTVPREDALGVMGHELRRLRAALETQLRGLGPKVPDAQGADLASRMERLGIGRTLADGVAAKIGSKGYAPEKVWAAARAALAERICVIEEDVVHNGGVMALIGPTGVGKTTTVAKLAARFALRFGRKHVALITTDAHRVGAQEQLLTFGEILGIAVESASSRGELGQLLQRYADRKLVLVDNAGLSQRDLRLAAQLSDLEAVPFIKTYLVVSCTTQAPGLDDVFAAFGRTKLQGCILTKLDEAVSLGPVIDILARYRLPLVYGCDGQRIPEDIHPGFSADLVGRAESLAQEVSSYFAPEFNYGERLAANGFA
jgi:flagellar biosynthesis protein FlhF